MPITDIKGCLKLNNGIEMPYFGLGVFQISDGKEVINAVEFALENGYRHIDTAALYGNEIGVGEAVRNSGIDRSEIFVTSKVWNSDLRNGTTLGAFEESMKRLKLDYLDLYLIHWPVKGKYVEAWKALESIYKSGRVKAIGVSNFLQHHIEDIKQNCEIIPTVNQVEFHPYLVQQDLIDYCNANNIVYEAWSPLKQGQILSDKTLKGLADKYNKTVAQIILRWDLQKGVITIPKSTKKGRIISNSQIFDFKISKEDMDRDERIGAHPDNFNF